MERFEFADFYKFCVSFGLASMLFAIIIPWVLVRETAWVEAEASPPKTVVAVVEVDQQKKSASTARVAQLDQQQAHRDRARLVRIAFEWVGAAVLFFAIVGVSSFSYGVFKWRGRQVKRDKRENAEIDQLIDSIAPKASPALVAEQALLDYKSDGMDDGDDEIGKANERLLSALSPMRSSLDVETRILDLMESGMSDYALRRQRSLGSIVADAILLSLDRRKSDVVVEIKLIQRGFRLGWLVEVMQRVSMMVDLYVDRSGRRARGLLVVVIADNLMSSILDKISSAINSVFIGPLDGVAVVFVSQALVLKGDIGGRKFYAHEHGLLVIQKNE